MAQRFVILAAQRTGSYMLATALDALPGVTCHGELFRKNDKGVAADSAIIEKLDPAFADIGYRHRHHAEFLDAVVRHTPAELVGFKLMLRQAPEAQKAIVGSDDYRVILLDRGNVLALYSSHLIARATGVGFMRKGEQAASPRVEFDAGDFSGFWRRYRNKYEELRDQVRDFGRCRMLSVDYLDLLHGGAFGEVVDFLGLRCERDISKYIGTQKRNSSEILQRFSNPDAVVDYLREAGRLDWCREQRD